MVAEPTTDRERALIDSYNKELRELRGRVASLQLEAMRYKEAAEAAQKEVDKLKAADPFEVLLARVQVLEEVIIDKFGDVL